MSNASISQKNEINLRNDFSQVKNDKINQRYSPKMEDNSSFYSNLKIDKYIKKNSIPYNKENRDMTNISFNPYESIISNNFQYQNEDPFSTNIENIECNNSKLGPLFSENSFDLDILKSQRNSANPNDKKQKLRSFGSDREIKDLKDRDSNIIDNSNLEVKIIEENSNLEEEKNVNLMSKRKISNLFNNINYGHIQEVNEEDEEDKKSNLLPSLNENDSNNNSNKLQQNVIRNNLNKTKSSYNREKIKRLSKTPQKEINLTHLGSKKSSLSSFFKIENQNNISFNGFYSVDNFSFDSEESKNNNEKEVLGNKINNIYENNFENKNENKKENNENKINNIYENNFEKINENKKEKIENKFNNIYENNFENKKENNENKLKNLNEFKFKNIYENTNDNNNKQLEDENNIEEEKIKSKEILKDAIREINNINKLIIQVNDNDIGENYFLFEIYPKISKDNQQSNYLKREISKFIDDEESYYFLLRRNSFLDNNYFEYKLSIDSSGYDRVKNNKNYSRKQYNLFESEDMTFNQIKNRKYIFKKGNKIKISEIEDIKSLIYKLGFKNYKNPILLDIISSITSFRQVENDGNSFYRSFCFALIENYVNKNKNEDLIFITNDIMKSIPKDINNFDKIINVIKQFKNNYSLDLLEEAFNDPELFFDEAIILYFHKCIGEIKNINDINYYYDINFEFFKNICNIFDVNIEIFYLDGNEFKPKFNKSIIKSNQSNYETITIYLGYFFNSFHIIYTKDELNYSSSLINKNLSKEIYIINNLREIKCQKCRNATSSFVLIIKTKTLFCYNCLNFFLNNILINRAIMFVKNNFIDLEYYTRPINVFEDIEITSQIYFSIYKKSILDELYDIILKLCFNCHNISDSIIRLKCKCQFCQNCLESFIDKSTDNYKILNEFEKNSRTPIKCLCKSNFNLDEAIKYSKGIKEDDYEEAKKRLFEYIQKLCCICTLEKGRFNSINLDLKNEIPHLICVDCYEELLKNNDSNILNRENDDSFSIGNGNKIDCKICCKEHYLNQTNKILRKNKHKNICCNSKCFIY